jgi:tetratricopeptide (TPR) repeat protein
MVYAVLAVLVFVFIVFTNVNTILADVYYKTGLAYDNAQRYDGSVLTYQSALRKTPGQDFYLLFLGRSYMELARQFPDRKATPVFDVTKESPLEISRERLATLGREDLVQSSLAVLLEARNLNPLNTDHYANLARLYNFWGQLGDQSKFDTGYKYFAQAISLSPNNAQLWNEWACTYSRLCTDWVDSPAVATRVDQAIEKLQHSLQLDDRFDLTYYYLGNVYMYKGERSQDQTQRSELLAKSAEAYSSCLKLTPGYIECAKARGYLYGKYLGRSEEAIADFKLVLSALPKPEDLTRITNTAQKQQATQELININQNLAITYGQIGQFDQALVHAQVAATLAPNDQAIKTLVEQLKTQIQQKK